MSLFDVIRYPVSDIPTEEELAKIPYDIIREWKKVNYFWDEITPREISNYFGMTYCDRDIEAVINLRQMIKDYDNL